MIKFIEGGVCAPNGFKAAGVHCGIRKGKLKKDLALIVSETAANAAAVYTTNLVKAAPVLVTRENLKNGRASAMLCNSGIANACVADGIEKARGMCKLVSGALGIPADNVIVASTGVIGQSLNLTPVAAGVAQLVKELSPQKSAEAAQAIMTTDTIMKEVAVCVDIGGRNVKIGGIAKGSGMINPKLATMLAFLTTDAEIDSETLSAMLKDAAENSFNRVSVDGDTSTNDMLSIMANGKSGVKIGKSGDGSYAAFKQGLDAVCVHLAKLLAKDGEGATKMVECAVKNAPDIAAAAKIADSIINSSLVKTAMFGEDANWGRILCAAGYSGAAFDPQKTDISLRSAAGAVLVCQNGAGVDFSEEKAAEILKCNEITIDVNLNQGSAAATAWGCDLSYDYVKINGDYRT